MTTTASSLYDAANELLGKAKAILTAGANGAPAFCYVSHGPPPYDCCDMLTVHVGMIENDPDFLRTGTMGRHIDPKMPTVPRVPLTVTVLRCQNALPGGGTQITMPTAAQMDADAKRVSDDGWTLFCGLHKAYRDGSLFTGYPCRPVEVGSALPVAPEGGCLGWAIAVMIELDGFDPAGA